MTGRAATRAFHDRAGAAAFLRELGRGGDERWPIAEAALALAVFDAGADELGRYRDHLAALALEVGAAARGAATLAPRIEALTDVLFRRHGYAGDTETYDDPQNANLMRVIDRRRGLPVALGVLAIDVARAQGWRMAGLALPGHFLVRIDGAGEHAILDPFNGGRTRDAADLRELVRAVSGGDLALAPEHYAAVSDRDVLLRLQNNLKLRALEAGKTEMGFAILDRMLLIAPAASRLWREAALLHAELGNYRAAAEACEQVIAHAGDGAERRRGQLLREHLRLRLN